MGSGRDNRKKKDRTIIRRPVKVIGSGGGFSPRDKGGMAADICLPSFEQRVKANALVVPGVRVHLQQQADIYLIMLGATEIGKLTKIQSEMITKCEGLGLRYAGVIVGKKGTTNLYARFSRIPG